jgi:hypothetical protein
MLTLELPNQWHMIGCSAILGQSTYYSTILWGLDLPPLLVAANDELIDCGLKELTIFRYAFAAKVLTGLFFSSTVKVRVYQNEFTRAEQPGSYGKGAVVFVIGRWHSL